MGLLTMPVHLGNSHLRQGLHFGPRIPNIAPNSKADQDSTSVLARSNMASTLLIDESVRRQGPDPWRGIGAVGVAGPLCPLGHYVVLPINAGDNKTIIGPPIWVWETDDLIAGEYHAPATTFNKQNHNPFNDHALLGLVPLSRLLPRTIRRPILL